MVPPSTLTPQAALHSTYAGDVVIDGSTINANPAGGFAFDVCRYSSYPSVNVTVKGNSVINGNVEVYASGSDAKDGFSLTLESGTLNGNIVVDKTAAAAMAATPDKAEVDKATSFTAAAPAGYVWVADATDGGQTLAKNPKLFVGHSRSQPRSRRRHRRELLPESCDS